MYGRSKVLDDPSPYCHYHQIYRMFFTDPFPIFSAKNDQKLLPSIKAVGPSTIAALHSPF